MTKILLAHDSEVGEIYKGMLLRRGHEVINVADADAAVSVLRRRTFDMVLTVCGMNGSNLDGMRVAMAAKAANAVKAGKAKGAEKKPLRRILVEEFRGGEEMGEVEDTQEIAGVEFFDGAIVNHVVHTPSGEVEFSDSFDKIFGSLPQVEELSGIEELLGMEELPVTEELSQTEELPETEE